MPTDPSAASGRRPVGRPGAAGSGTGRVRPGRDDADGGGADTAGRRELILRLLRTSPQPRGILSLAEELGVHANTVRFHLDVLLRTGQAEQLLGETTGPGRPPVLFRATHRMDPDGPTNYRLLATMLTSHLATSSPDPAATAIDLGRAWGPHLIDITPDGRSRSSRVTRGEILTQMTGVLTDLGFAPEPPASPRDTTIRLHHCPFLDLVTDLDHGDLICSLHLGLMQGALASLHGSVTVDRLDPFVEPDLCVAHLAPAVTAARRGRVDE